MPKNFSINSSKMDIEKFEIAIKKIDRIRQSLFTILPHCMFNDLQDVISTRIVNFRYKTKTRLMHKYDSISCNKLKNLNTRNKIWVKNTGNYEPSEAEWSVLEKGLNYAMPNFKQDLPKLVSTVENITTNLTGISEEERTILTHQISSAINCAQKHETISKEESTAL